MAFRNLDKKVLPACLSGSTHIDSDAKDCYDFSGYQFALFPEAVTQMNILMEDERLYVREFYTGFDVLKIGKGMKKLNTSEESYSEINTTYLKIRSNTFRSLYTSTFIDFNDACELIGESNNIYGVTTYNIYRSGCFFRDIPLDNTLDGVKERIQSSYHRETSEEVSQENTLFEGHSRNLIGKLFSNKTNYQLEMSQAELVVDVTGPYNAAIIFNIDNPEIDVNLFVRTFHEAIITQKEDGIIYNTKKVINGSIVSDSKFYPKHLVAVIQLWIANSPRRDILPEGFYIRLQRNFKKCDEV
ncbi:unnamed protein product [Gordionus sp. m RMFG-2023]